MTKGKAISLKQKDGVTIGSIIRKAREGKNLDRPALAALLEVSAAYLSHIETDNNITIGTRMLGALKTHLGLELPQNAVDAANAKTRAFNKAYLERRKAQQAGKGSEPVTSATPTVPAGEPLKVAPVVVEPQGDIAADLKQLGKDLSAAFRERLPEGKKPRKTKKQKEAASKA